MPINNDGSSRYGSTLFDDISIPVVTPLLQEIRSLPRIRRIRNNHAPDPLHPALGNLSRSMSVSVMRLRTSHSPLHRPNSPMTRGLPVLRMAKGERRKAKGDGVKSPTPSMVLGGLIAVAFSPIYFPFISPRVPRVCYSFSFPFCPLPFSLSLVNSPTLGSYL